MIKKTKPGGAGQLLSSCTSKPLYDLYLVVLALVMMPCVFIEVTEAWKSSIKKTCLVKDIDEGS